MSALPADIIRATREARTVIRTDAAIKSLYPNARDGLLSPETGYFENASDAQEVLALKAALIGQPRGRYGVGLGTDIVIDPTSGIPTYQVADSEIDLDKPALVTRAASDLENETTRLEVMG